MKTLFVAVTVICLLGCQAQPGQRFDRANPPPVHCIALGLDGKKLAIESKGVIRFWDVVRHRDEKSFRVGDAETSLIQCLAFSPDGKKLAVAGAHGRLEVWDVEAGKLDRRYKGHDGVVWRVQFSREGERLFSCEGNCFKVWDAMTGKEIGKSEGHGKMDISISLSGDGKWLASGSFDEMSIIIWDVENNPRKTATMKTECRVQCLSLSRDGKSLLVNHYGKVDLWDVAARKPVGAFEGLGQAPHFVAFSPNGRLVAARGATEIAVWDVSTFRKLTSFKHLSLSNGFMFTPDSSDLIWCQTNGVVRKETLPRP